MGNLVQNLKNSPDEDADRLSRFYLIVDIQESQVEDYEAVESRVESALHGGARLLQLRAKRLNKQDIWNLAARLIRLTRQYEARLLINTHAEVCRQIQADGVHRPSLGPPVPRLRAAASAEFDGQIIQDLLVGVSAHSLDEALDAQQQGADFVTLSPIFESASKPGYGPQLGLGGLAQICERVEIPVFALAGVTPARVQDCLNAGAYGVSVMGGVTRASDPTEAVRAYLRHLM